MNLFSDYIQPLINWLHVNPHWALFFTFLISLSESLAILGAIIPGSVTMTAIGILAGSGVIRIDLTLIAAILGAVCGDSLSYAIGYFYSDKILYVWPLNKYPSWWAYGKDFFSKHGSKSVLLGRFIGPLRSIIPIIAGIMHMKQGQFLIANVLSAIGWSFLYIMPGVLIGAASSELSTESATRLFIIILVLLASIWLLTFLIKYLFIKINKYLRKNLHFLWSSLKKHPILYQFFNFFTPKQEKNHYLTVILLATVFLSLLAFILLTGLHIQNAWIRQINLAIYLLLQSFRSPSLQAFFIFCTQFTSAFTMMGLFILYLFYSIKSKQFTALLYLISTITFTFFLVFLLMHTIYSPAPQGYLGSKQNSSFPAIDIAVATAFYSFIYFYVSSHYNYLSSFLRSFLFIILGLSSLGALFLGDYWLSDVIAAFCVGLFISLLHCLMYRKKESLPTKQNPSSVVFYFILMSVCLLTGLSTAVHFKELSYKHIISSKEYYLADNEWWNQPKTMLPIYLRNRLGKPISVLNIQYLGNLEALKNSLAENHWVSHQEKFFAKLMQRINPESNTVKLPLFEVLYENKHPVLMMILKDPSTDLVLELRIWESNYYLKEINEPLWLGNIRVNSNTKAKTFQDPVQYLIPSLNAFIFKKIQGPKSSMKSKNLVLSPSILLIRNRP